MLDQQQGDLTGESAIGQEAKHQVVSLVGDAVKAGGAIAMAGDWVRSKLEGTEPDTQAQDWWFKNAVGPSEELAQSFAGGDNQPWQEKVARAVVSVGGVIAPAVLTGGESVVSNRFAAGAINAQIPAIHSAIAVGQHAYQETGDGALAIKLAMTSYATSVLQMMMPLSRAGGLATGSLQALPPMRPVPRCSGWRRMPSYPMRCRMPRSAASPTKT